MHMHKLTMSFISASAKDLPSTIMLQTTLLNCKEIHIAYDGLLFFSFSISRSCAAFCSAILKDAEATFLDFCACKSSFFNPFT